MLNKRLSYVAVALWLAPGRATSAPARGEPAASRPNEAAPPDERPPSAAECEQTRERLEHQERSGQTLYSAGRCAGEQRDYVHAVDLLDEALGDVRLPFLRREQIKRLRQRYEQRIVATPVSLEPTDAEISIGDKQIEAKPGPRQRPLVRAGSIDGTAKPPASAFVLQLSEGYHTIKVTRQGYAPLVLTDRYFSPEQPARWCPTAATAGGDCMLKLQPLAAQVVVTSSEGEATISLNGKPTSKTPPGANVSRTLNLKPGTYELKVDKSGHEAYETKFAITPDQSFYSINAKLNDIPFYRKPAYYIPAASAVVAVVVAAAIWSYNSPAYDGGSSGIIIDPSKK